MAMEGTGIGKDLTEIAGAILAIALVALLIGHASATSNIISSGTSGFNSLLQTVTLQNQGFGVGTLGSGYNSFSSSGL